MIIINRLVAFLILIVTTVIYTGTVAPTVSFWDCGEFIASCYNLAVTHPPGAPLYLLVGRIFSLLPIADDIALRVNLISCLSSSLTIFFLYFSIVYLVREAKGRLTNKSDWLTAISCGLLGSLTLAFTHSFWFNAVETEVYAPSTLVTSIIIWLTLLWAQKYDQAGNERYLLVIAYMLGLSICIHLLNVLVLPFITMIYYSKKYQFTMKSMLRLIIVTVAIFFLIYPLIVKYIPYATIKAGPFALIVIGGIIFSCVIWSIKRKYKLVNLISVSILVFIIGYSTYGVIPIRSRLNPNIDINDPETAENFYKYINREQYGDHSIFDRASVWKASASRGHYESAWDYFWKYQVNKMYVRYFLWQFVGLDENETDWSFNKFYALPLILGLVGLYWHFKNNYKSALAVLALFLATGLALVVYLNQADPQPRERDYSYVISFLSFSIWIGLSYASVLHLLKKIMVKLRFSEIPKLLILSFIMSLLPLYIFIKNYDSHDRSGRYVAWDYAYNMLQTCDPNAILFTGGDNDTYPLWYLQEVEGIRNDVRIVNLELLNTDWYVRQLRDLKPKVPIRMSDEELTRLGFIPWQRQMVALNVPKHIAISYNDEYRTGLLNSVQNLPTKISFTVFPSHKTPYGSFLCVRDSMILRILQANKWNKAVYFSASAPIRSYPEELRQYFRMDGLIYKLVPYKKRHIDPQRLERNLIEVYKYRGLSNRDVNYDKVIKAYLQNYRSAFLELAYYYARIDNMLKVQYVISQMEEKISEDVIPWTNKHLRLIRDEFKLAASKSKGY